MGWGYKFDKQTDANRSSNRKLERDMGMNGITSRMREEDLKVVFLKHLPQRLHTLLWRTRTQLRSGWDVNAMHRLQSEYTTLAGTAGRYGLIEPSTQLEALAQSLTACLQAERLPDSAEGSAIAILLDAVQSSMPVIAQFSVQPGTDEADQAELHNGYAQLEQPPDEYWIRLDHTAYSNPAPDREPSPPQTVSVDSRGAEQTVPIPIDSTGSSTASKTTDATIDSPPPSEHVADPPSLILVGKDTLLQELEILYTQGGIPCRHVDDTATIMAMLQGKKLPELIVLGTSSLPRLTDLSEKLRTMHTDTNHDVSLLAILDHEDLSARLEALRAGADHAISRTLGTQVIAAQIEAMLEARKEKAYRVLVIDDDAPQAAFAEAILRKAGMQIRVVTDALNSLDELDQFQPDLILMDINMPGADGLELTRLIREREDFMTTPIVFLSGDQDSDRRFAALEVGGDDFITKPVRPRHLISAISNRIRRSRLSARQRIQKPSANSGGICDRNTLLDRLHQRLAAASGTMPKGSLGLFEFDHSSTLRQELGLSGLDRLLQESSHWLAECLDPGDYVAPFGQSAMLLLSESRNETQLTELAGELIQAVTQQRFEAAGSRALSLSAGICGLDTGSTDPAYLFGRCDQTLELAHQQGGMAIAHSEQLIGKDPPNLGDTLRKALDNDTLHLVFQPLVPVGDVPPEAQYQTLLRLRDDQGNIHSAVELIPQAEAAKLLDAVDRWVLKQAISIIAARQRMGTKLRLFVPQSFAVIDQVWGDSTLRKHLLEAHIPESSLVLEYRVDELGSGVSRLAGLAADLHPQGVRLALSQIHDLQLARTLLDACAPEYLRLAPELADSTDADALAALAHAHEAKVIGPRVNDAGMAAAFYSAGVDYLQGNFIQEAGNTLNYAFHQQS